MKEEWKVESFRDGAELVIAYRDGKFVSYEVPMFLEYGEADDDGDREWLDGGDWFDEIQEQSSGECYEALGDPEDGEGWEWDEGDSPCAWRSADTMPEFIEREES